MKVEYLAGMMKESMARGIHPVVTLKAALDEPGSIALGAGAGGVAGAGTGAYQTFKNTVLEPDPKAPPINRRRYPGGGMRFHAYNRKATALKALLATLLAGGATTGLTYPR